MKKIAQVGEGGNMYLSILEKRDICREEMKQNRKKYFKRVRATLKSKHLFQAINMWVVLTVPYGAGIIELTKEEVKEMDRKTRKIVTLSGCTY